MKIKTIRFKRAYETGGFPFGYMGIGQLENGNYFTCDIVTCDLKGNELITQNEIQITGIYDSEYIEPSFEFFKEHLIGKECPEIINEIVCLVNENIR